MNLKLIISGLTFCLLIGSQDANSQADLRELLVGKTKLWEIMEVVDKYYLDHPEDENEFESDLLHWKRWEYYMSSHLGPGGEFVNIPDLLMKGMKEKEKMPGSNDRNINSGWSFVGYSSSPLQNADALYNGIGRVDRITFHPTNQNIIFICTPDGGLWGTLNGGSSWNNLTDNLPSIGVSGFVITPSNPSIMYLLTGDGDGAWPGGLLVSESWVETSAGVYKSTDGGVSWHETGTFPETVGNFYGFRLVQSPDDPDLLMAATSDGLYRTTNGGDTWVRELNLPTYDIEFKPGTSSRVYASVQGDIWISTNSGAGWTSNSTYDFNPNNCGSGGGRIEIAVSPTNTPKVYLFSGPVTGIGSFCGLWLSTDSGVSFTRQSSTPNVIGLSDNGNDNNDQSFYDLAIACRTDLSTGIVVGGNTVWRSTDGGQTWIHATGFNEDSSFPYIHPDVHDLAYNPLNHWLYAATDGGFYRSTDYGVTWTDLSQNIEANQIYHMRGWDGDVNKLMIGLQDNGVKYRMSNSSAFAHIDGADGFDVAFDPDTGEPAYASINASVVKYSGDGSSSTSVTPTGYNLLSLFFKPIAIHNTDPDILLVGTNDILKTTTGGNPYTNTGAAGGWSLTSCPSNSNRFYAAGGNNFQSGSGSLYRSNDEGDTWTVVSGNTGFPSSSSWSKINDVTVKPNNSSVVWACFGGFNDGIKVVTSGDAGNSWANVSFNLPNVPVYCLAIDNNNGAYAGTDIGVFYLGPTVSAWMPWSNKLPNTIVSDLVIFDDGVSKKIRAATFGRGVWQSDLASTCDASVIVTGSLEGVMHYEAINSLSSSGFVFVEGGIGTFVSFQSGNYITLSEGFNVVDNSEFLGFISPCGQGGIPSAQDDVPINRSDQNSSIIPLRRMWDPEDGLSYGTIDQLEINNNQALIEYSIKKAGKVQLYAAREIQDQLVTLYNGELNSGVHKVEADISNLPRAFHYILLFYEGKLVHFQEMDLRIQVVSTNAQRPTDFQRRQ